MKVDIAHGMPGSLFKKEYCGDEIWFVLDGLKDVVQYKN